MAAKYEWYLNKPLKKTFPLWLACECLLDKDDLGLCSLFTVDQCSEKDNSHCRFRDDNHAPPEKKHKHDKYKSETNGSSATGDASSHHSSADTNTYNYHWPNYSVRFACCCCAWTIQVFQPCNMNNSWTSSVFIIRVGLMLALILFESRDRLQLKF